MINQLICIIEPKENQNPILVIEHFEYKTFQSVISSRKEFDDDMISFCRSSIITLCLEMDKLGYQNFHVDFTDIFIHENYILFNIIPFLLNNNSIFKDFATFDFLFNILSIFSDYNFEIKSNLQNIYNNEYQQISSDFKNHNYLGLEFEPHDSSLFELIKRDDIEAIKNYKDECKNQIQKNRWIRIIGLLLHDYFNKDNDSNDFTDFSKMDPNILSEIAKIYTRKEPLRMNLSGETTISDFEGKLISDPNSMSGLKFQNGTSIDVYENGLVLILDEINFAPPSVLQFLEGSLDNN